MNCYSLDGLAALNVSLTQKCGVKKDQIPNESGAGGGVVFMLISKRKNDIRSRPDITSVSV